jgi:tetratricopeptide (TPR) repeat protein
MPDLSKHLARAKQALERRNYDLAIETCIECIDIAPTDLEFHATHLEAARRKAKEVKKSLIPSLGFGGLSKDPHKLFVGAVKKLSGNPDGKVVVEVGDAALKASQAGTKPMAEVAVFYYEDFKKGGLFNDKVLWNLAQLYFEKYKEIAKSDKEAAKGWLERAIKTMDELNRAMPNHPEAAKQVKNWEAMRSMERRNEAGQAADYRSQLANDANARRQEVMNRMIRTPEDAKEVLNYINEDLKANVGDKAMWIKKGDIHRRFSQLGEARTAFEKAQAIDAHDYTVTMKLGDIRIDELKAKVVAAGPDAAEAKRELLTVQIEEYRKRVERQPTDMGHRFELAKALLGTGNVDQAAGELQRTVNDPRLRRPSHRLLGYCFTKKNLLDLGAGQYAAYLQLVEDELAEEAKEVRYNLGRVYEDLGKKADAIATYEKLVNIDLGYKDAATRLSKLRGTN